MSLSYACKVNDFRLPTGSLGGCQALNIPCPLHCPDSQEPGHVKITELELPVSQVERDLGRQHCLAWGSGKSHRSFEALRFSKGRLQLTGEVTWSQALALLRGLLLV